MVGQVQNKFFTVKDQFYLYYFYAKANANFFSSFQLFKLCCSGGLSLSWSGILSTPSKIHFIKLSGLTSSCVLLLIKVEKLYFRRYQCCCNYFDYQNIVERSEALKHSSLTYLSPFLSSSMSFSPFPTHPPPFFFSFPGLQCLTTWWYERH